jgi:hypothetical protein
VRAFFDVSDLVDFDVRARRIEFLSRERLYNANSLTRITVGCSLSLFFFFAAAFDPQSTVTWLL